MRKNSDDGSCAKLILKKSSGHLKISLLMFLVSIAITMIIGLLYARQYFQYEKDFLENVAVRTVYVDAHFDESSVQAVTSADIRTINQALGNAFPEQEVHVIPVYTCMGVYINGSSACVFAMDKQQSFFIGLEQMQSDTAYFTKKQPDTIALEINVTQETEEGLHSDEIKRLLLKTDTGVSERTPVLSAQNQYLTPSMQDSPVFFVDMETFREIASVLLARPIENINEAADNSELVMFSGLYIYVDDLRLVSAVSSFLTTQNYRAYAPTDAFDDFEETVSVTFIVFLCSAVVLLCMTTINIFLSFRSFYRVQQRDMGVLRYMGFSYKRIYKMYCKNLQKKFLQILLVCSLLVLLIGMILFSFAHWLILFSFILALAVFLCVLYLVIAKCIIYPYVNQDLLILIRESKEFE